MVKAGKLFLHELDRLVGARLDFAFESTLSGIASTSRLKKWKAIGYRVEIVFPRPASPQLALAGLPPASNKAGITCRELTSCGDLTAAGKTSRPFTNRWRMRGKRTIIPPTIRDYCSPKMKTKSGKYKNSLVGAGRALRRAALAARKTARLHGTPVYVWRDGKVVAEKP